MDDQADRGAQDAPPLLTNLKGWIAGLTGLVVATAGLIGAYRQLVPASQAQPATEAASSATGGQAVAAVGAASTAEEDVPMLYEGADGIKLEFTDDKWVLTTSEGVWDHEDMYSKYDGSWLAFDKVNNAYLRWPIKGGMAEESTDDKQTWKSYAELYPPAEEEEPAPAQ